MLFLVGHGAGFAAGVEGRGDFFGGEEELEEGDRGCEDEFGLVDRGERGVSIVGFVGYKCDGMGLEGMDGGTHSTFVNGVDEGDESPGQIPFSVRHGRHARHDKGPVTPHQLEIIGHARRFANQLVEREHGGFAARFGHVDISAPDLVRSFMRGVAFGVSQESKPLLGVGDGGFV